MRRFSAIFAIVGSASLMAGQAQAQVLNGDELLGQTVDVRLSDGTMNSVRFDAGGHALLQGDGITQDASWAINNNQLCLQTTDSRECWAYSQRFVAGQSSSMVSSCNEASEWTAREVNPSPMPVSRMGERG